MLIMSTNYDTVPAAGCPGMIDAIFVDTKHFHSMRTIRRYFGPSTDSTLRAFGQRFALVTATGAGFSTRSIGTLEDLTSEFLAYSNYVPPIGIGLAVSIMSDAATKATINAAVLGVQP